MPIAGPSSRCSVASLPRPTCHFCLTRAYLQLWQSSEQHACVHACLMHVLTTGSGHFLNIYYNHRFTSTCCLCPCGFESIWPRHAVKSASWRSIIEMAFRTKTRKFYITFYDTRLAASTHGSTSLRTPPAHWLPEYLLCNGATSGGQMGH